MLTWNCGKDQQEEQTSNGKCEAKKLVIVVKSCYLIKFSTIRFSVSLNNGFKILKNFNCRCPEHKHYWY